jgi:hypothetical protein
MRVGSTCLRDSVSGQPRRVHVFERFCGTNLSFEYTKLNTPSHIQAFDASYPLAVRELDPLSGIDARTSRLADIERCDVICIPGGFTATEAALDKDYLPHVRRLAESSRYITSVCSAAGKTSGGCPGLIRSGALCIGVHPNAVTTQLVSERGTCENMGERTERLLTPYRTVKDGAVGDLTRTVIGKFQRATEFAADPA